MATGSIGSGDSTLGMGFRLRFGREERSGSDAASGEGAGKASASGPEIEVEAFGDDCHFTGHMSLTRDRLLDMLNSDEPLRLRDLRVVTLDDGEAFDAPQLSVERHELFAVVGEGPRGDPARRIHTRTSDVEVVIGPYIITGALHGTPASDPLVSVLRRQRFVALTDATIRQRIEGDDGRGRDAGGAVGEVVASVPTLLVNRERAYSFRAAHDPQPGSAVGHLPVSPAD